MAMSESTRPESEFERDGGFAGESEQDMPFAEEDARENVEELADTGELELDDGDRLPWLEVDDEEDDYSGVNTGQIIAFVLLGLVVLGLLVGGIWWFSRKGADEQLVADGSVIEAPDEPYRQQPENPGGKTFEGTGDSSFAVSEGETRPAQLGRSQEAPRPGFDTMDTAGSSGGKAPAGSSGGKAPAGSSGGKAPAMPGQASAAVTTAGVGVQINAYSTRSGAESGWQVLSQRYEALSGMRHRVVAGQADFGTVYRLQAIAEDAGSAAALCRSLKASGLNCFVKN